MKTEKSSVLIIIVTLLIVLSIAPNIKAASSTTTQNNIPTSSVNQQTYDSITSTTTQITHYIDSYYVMVNNHTLVLDTPAILIHDKAFIPAKNIADYTGIDLAWNPKLNVVELKTAKAYIQFDLAKKLVSINGISGPFENIAAMSKGKLMLNLEWFSNYTGAVQTYNAVTKLINITYVKQPDALSDAANSSRPVAKFTFTKPTYRMGETVQYVDLSYDPDAEGMRYEWTGKQDAFFTAGTYPITLKVFDSAGHESAAYTRSVVIENSLYLNEVQYPIYNQPVGTSFKTDWNMVWYNFNDLPILTKQVFEDTSRTLLVSDSPETIMEKGILYQDTIHGKGRLYADHLNGTTDKIRFTIMAKNMTDQPVTIKTTNKGEVYPSIYANLIGHEASVDFMLHDPPNMEPLIVPAGQSLVYIQMPDFYPGQGVNVFYDVETDGDLQFSFVASDSNTPAANVLDMYKPLAFDGHDRGTFPVADKTWNVDLTSFTTPSRLRFGDGVDDPFVKGYDTERKSEVTDMGNYGMIYHIHADKPRKMAVLLLAKGGPFKGPFKINGQFIMAPSSGVIMAFESIEVLARTSGTEDSFDLEFTPPAGSAFPIDVIFYPLESLEQLKTH